MAAPNVVQSTISADEEKYLASRLLSRTMLKLVSAQICMKEKQPKGSGTTAHFIRYKRMGVPMVTLTEGVDPTPSTIEIEELTVTLDQWGDIVDVSDIAELSAFHPLMTEITEQLSDNAQRVIDREVQLVWLAGTNVQYGDATVTTRATITAAMTITDNIIHQQRVSMSMGGAPPFDAADSNDSNDAKQNGAIKSVRQGKAYVAITDPNVMADVMKAGTSLGTWAAVAMYANQMALYNAEVGTWLGFRWIETNFIPQFSINGGVTTAVVSTNAYGTGTPVVTAVDGGGTLTSGATYYWKSVRKSTLDGFADEISIEHTMAAAATGNNESFTFAWPATAGYVYDLYFGSATGDSNLKLVTANILPSVTTTVTAVSSSTTTAPANTNVTLTPTIHVVYFHGAGSTSWVGLQDLAFYVTKNESIIGNVLQLKRAAGYKFMNKAMIRNQAYIRRLEIASAFTN